MPAMEGKAASAWIDEYVREKGGKLRSVAEGLRRLMKQHGKGVRESVNPWKIPTFASNGPMCFFMVGKNHVTLGFLRGAALRDKAGLLEGTGKNLRHVKLKSVEDLKTRELQNLIGEAVKLNQKEPTEGRKVKKKAKT